MVTFLHLSDIHFVNRDSGSSFDIDQQIRRALLDDAEKMRSATGGYDGVLVTGDIAYSGDTKEYQRAQEFLDVLFERTQTSPAATFVIPGNHDVDRRYLLPDLPLWAAHVNLRASSDPVIWRDHIYKQLVKDPQRSLLSPLNNYNSFAQGYGCFTGMLPRLNDEDNDRPQIAWHRIFNKPLDDGSRVELHGINSALVSDGGDAPGRLLVSEFQTSHLVNKPNVVNVVMCHHPSDWLMDKSAIRNAFGTFAPVVLCGHEHDARVDSSARQVQLFAGAVQPSRRDPGHWLPTYHILQLGVRNSGSGRQLIVRIQTREFTGSVPVRFRPRRDADEQTVQEYFIALPPWESRERPEGFSVDSSRESGVSSPEEEAMPATDLSTEAESANFGEHELQVYFFRLKTPLRYETAFKAGLLRNGDDSLDPHVMWATVFKRAADEHRQAEFWDAISPHEPMMKSKPNPFNAKA